MDYQPHQLEPTIVDAPIFSIVAVLIYIYTILIVLFVLVVCKNTKSIIATEDV